MTDSYSRACTEVLVLLKYYLKDDDYNKIPKDVIAFYEKNKDINYQYEVNSNVPLEEQEISEKANAIIINIFRDYFATETQKEKLENILINNDKIIEERKREKYNLDNLFKNNKTEEQIQEDQQSENVQMIEYKEENVFGKILNKIRTILDKLQKKIIKK